MKTRTYGKAGTIHQTTGVNVEIGPDGRVVSVWFRCMTLPFDETRVSQERADEMRQMYESHPAPKLIAVEVVEDER